MNRTKVGLAVATLALAVAACAGSSVDDLPTVTTGPVEPGDPIAGAAVYRGTCAGCHGVDLEGVGGLGSALAPSDWVADRSEDEIVDFLLVGREADHPENMQGIAMPPRGGNPSLSDQDLHDVAAYLLAQQ